MVPNNRLYNLLLPLVFVLASCGSDKRPSSPNTLGDGWAGESSVVASEPLLIPDDAPRVVILGDSLSAGLHLDEDLAYPAIVQRRLVERGLPFDLVNAGISGDTTAGGLSRIDWLLKQEPAVVVVELGANDGLRGQELEAIETNLRGILERIRDAGSIPILCGMRIPPSYGLDYSEGFHALYGVLAEELDVVLVPELLEGVGGVVSLNLADGIHPNPRGHERVADNLEDILAEVLEGLR